MQNFWRSLNTPKVLFFLFADENLGDCGDELKWRFLEYARKRLDLVKGKMEISGICP